MKLATQDAVTGLLTRFFRDLRDQRPLLLLIVEELNRAAMRSIDRAQQIPLAASTVKRKRYPRRSRAGRAQSLLVNRATARALRQSESRRAQANARKLGSSYRFGANAIKKPKPNARILERVGGFIESLTQDDAPFAVRRLEADAVRFGTKLGGLWTQFAATQRLDFAATDESLEEIEQGLRLAQRQRLLDQCDAAGAPQSWEAAVRGVTL